MDLSFRWLSLSSIFSFCLSMDDANPKKSICITSFTPRSVLVKVRSTNIIGVSSSRFLLAECWFSSSPCFPFRLKKVTDWLRLVSPVKLYRLNKVEWWITSELQQIFQRVSAVTVFKRYVVLMISKIDVTLLHDTWWHLHYIFDPYAERKNIVERKYCLPWTGLGSWFKPKGF